MNDANRRAVAKIILAAYKRGWDDAKKGRPWQEPEVLWTSDGQMVFQFKERA